VIICADDFGWSDDIDRATLELIARQRATAVSCMVAVPRCSRAVLTPLLASAERIDLGLHLVLNNDALPCSAAAGSSLSRTGRFAGLCGLMRQSLLRRFRARDAEEEIAAQYRLFIERCGRAPDFIDSHLHVHQFPGLREGLLDFVSSLPAEQRPYIRNSYMPMAKVLRQAVSIGKCSLLSALGKTMRMRLTQNGIPTNHGFAGVYDYFGWRRYPDHLQRFVRHMEPGNAILMVHPGLDKPWRRIEFETLRDSVILDGRGCRFKR
jgi:chitin disaccharide deacetylase